VGEGYHLARMKAKNLLQNRSCSLVLEEVRQKSQARRSLGLRLAVAETVDLVVVVEEDLVLNMAPLLRDDHVEASDGVVVEGVLCQILDTVSFADLV
jgi:hypothetical protein